MLIGYARVPADQNPNPQVDALRRTGVDTENIHLDRGDGAKAARPQLDAVMQRLHEGDTLVITRLERLGRSVLHLITLGAELRDRGVHVKVLDQGIDTATAEGRAMFAMLPVLAECQRELTAANARAGLAAARAQGRKGGRPPRLSQDQIDRAQRLYDAGDHTVAQIAGLLDVPRTTVYGHLNTRPTPPSASPPAPPAGRPPRTCPTCGNDPTTRAEAAHQRADLAVDWLHPNPESPETVIVRNHCRQCEPGQPAFDIACTICGDGPILADALADQAGHGTLPVPVRHWLTTAGWTLTPDLRCPDHT